MKINGNGPQVCLWCRISKIIGHKEIGNNIELNSLYDDGGIVWDTLEEDKLEAYQYSVKV